MKKALLIEGLFSFNAGYVRKAFQRELEKRGFLVVSIPWTDSVKHEKIIYDLIISHSFGAGYAIKHSIKTKHLITMDARAWDFWNNSKLETYLPRHTNFYQKLPLRGYPIRGATNIDMGFCGHTNLPSKCFDYIGDLI